MSDELKDRIALVTGATSGIGAVTARVLADRGATVVLVGRDDARLETTRAAIVAATESDRVETMRADFASLEQVRGLAQRFVQRHDRLHLLINNAGAIYPEYGETDDGFEQTFGVNHLAPFLLTQLLLDALKAGAPSRVVNLSSDAHKAGRIDFEDLAHRDDYKSFRAYSQSKLANALFSRELARRLEGTGVTSNAVHPGVVKTGFGEEFSGFFAAVMSVMRPFMRTPENGARTTLHVATSPDLDEISGLYFANERERAPAKQALDDDAARRLWEVSEQLVGIA